MHDLGASTVPPHCCYQDEALILSRTWLQSNLDYLNIDYSNLSVIRMFFFALKMVTTAAGTKRKREVFTLKAKKGILDRLE